MPSPVFTKKKDQTMSFAAALNEVLTGLSVSRLSWPDEEDYIFMRADIVHIHNKEGDHRLILSRGDILGDDWVVTRSVN